MRRGVRSLQSRLSGNNREIRAFLRISEEEGPAALLHQSDSIRSGRRFVELYCELDWRQRP
jgi:hypothetical protein